MVFQLISPAFSHKGIIPARYTCKGENLSPQLQWADPPDGTASFGLIMDDPDALIGTWVHWVFYNIPGNLKGLPEGVPSVQAKNQYGVNGRNSWGKPGYGGPCPPAGTHRYFFKLYALDTLLDLPSGASKPDLIRSMQKHILAETELMGTFS
ncbi:MAG: YbhB/YbcL family Raf kinase inhibitor-like protein [Anaerolinea sp.]|nr:YbhB/YbcL family Raf kinase inhibitor-like protein [Anaerolinea sp.]